MKRKTTRNRTTTPVNSSRARRPSTAAVTAADFLETPLAMASSPSRSPESAIFGNSMTKRRSSKARTAGVESPALFASPSRPPTSLGSISDLKDMASSRLEDLKRHVDRSHVVIVKELDASHSRIHKRFKIQNQECQKVSDEAGKEYKKITDRISESQEALMTSYAEFMGDAQASVSHMCKTSIPKLSQSFEKAIDSLRSRYGISSGKPII